MTVNPSSTPQPRPGNSPSLAEARSESVFADAKPAMTLHEAIAEANRCLYCVEAPCIKACPTSIDIPSFIRKIATGNLQGSARTIFASNILGHSCARVCPVEELCAGDCVYNPLHEPPIAIGRLQRVATDAALAAGWQFFSAGAPTGFSVGLVGAGPASLACAHVLRRYGHAVKLYEKRGIAGGLNTWGVAPYKLRADEALRELDWLMAIGGIDVEYGVEIGRDVDFAGLEARHDALFVGCGLGADGALDVPGAQLPGVHGAVEFIERMKLGQVSLAGVRRAVVVGGGNTAVDALRELVGLGVPEVTLLYRGLEPGMSAYAHEWRGAKVDGARARFAVQPRRYLGETHVEAIEVDRLGPDKRPTGAPPERVEADLVLLAIGQEKLTRMLAGLPGIQLEHGRVVTDADGRTGRSGYFAGGDCRNGGKEVVNAAAEGQAAAHAIHASFAGQSPKEKSS
jgi:glutamate synthase (NADPH/NADH) small chain